MPANLPPQYIKAEDEYRRASTPADRLEALRELFRLLPKHKGTEKLQCDLKTKISRAREEIEGAKAGGSKKAGVSYKVPSEGAGQVVLVGPANAGKSALLAAPDQRQARGRPLPVHDPGSPARGWRPGRTSGSSSSTCRRSRPSSSSPGCPAWSARPTPPCSWSTSGDDDLVDAAEVALAQAGRVARRAGRRAAVRLRG